MRLAFTSALVAAAIGSAVAADSPMKPPMNSFMQAFYTCNAGGAFMMTYDGDLAAAKMRTSNDNKLYQLKRTPVATGVEYDGGGVKFWTDGKTVTVDGTQTMFRNCRVKSS